MKRSSFMLVQRAGRAADRASAGSEDVAREAAGDPALSGALEKLAPNLRQSLLQRAGRLAQRQDPAGGDDVARLRGVVEALSSEGPKVTVGVWDIDAWVGHLPDVIDALNEAQSTFVFFEVQAPVPVGLAKPAARIAQLARRAGVKVTKAAERDMEGNVLANDFYRHAEKVRKRVGVEQLAGLTRRMLTIETDDEFYWNHISASEGELLLVSTADLREFAKKARRPFEAIVAGVVVAQLLVAVSPSLGFHDDRGCLFDYNEARVTLVRSMKNPRIEKECLEKIDPQYRDAAIALLAALKAFKLKPAPKTWSEEETASSGEAAPAPAAALPAAAPEPPLASAEPRFLTLAELERRHIQEVLAALGGDRARAAPALGIDPQTLDAKIRAHGLDKEA